MKEYLVVRPTCECLRQPLELISRRALKAAPSNESMGSPSRDAFEPEC